MKEDRPKNLIDLLLYTPDDKPVKSIPNQPDLAGDAEELEQLIIADKVVQLFPEKTKPPLNSRLRSAARELLPKRDNKPTKLPDNVIQFRKRS